jgi:hypothetical protein
MIKNDFFNPKASFLRGVVLTALMAGFFLVPVTYAAIDETMPAVSAIPAEILADWKAQAQEKSETAATIKASLPEEYAAKCDGTLESACHWRRVYRMKQFPYLQSIMFARHHNIGAIAIGFWVNVGPADVKDTDFKPNGALCLLKFENYYSKHKEILAKTDACVKDPSISLDGKKVVFSMSGNGAGTGYRIYEMKIDDPSSIKQLTQNPSGLTVTDFEPCYLPNGDIMFASTRCFGVIDCGWQPTTNMFVMDSAGKYMRRVGFDQVHTFYPVLRPDGTVMYSRWEYNDRDIANIAGLFWMNPDGCHQTELFGNQTTWPMNFQHGRPVPGNPNKFFAIASAHHGDYSGEVCVVDITRNSNGPENVTMISPPRKTETRDNNDNFAFGGVYRNSEYPYPLSEKWYLVSYHDETKFNSMSYMHNTGKFRIYLKNVDGNSRELLAWGDQSLHTPVVVAPFKDIWGSNPPRVAEYADYSDSMGIFTMQDVNQGEGMKGVAKGVAKTLRVVALRWRVSGACDQNFGGQLSGSKPADVIFSAPAICPVSLWGGSWDVKEVLGEAKIFEDGSASFKVPARTPVYFEVLDSNGCMIAGMRSWSTLMPGETFSCLGCHENKTTAPSSINTALAGKAQQLDKLLGVEDQGFDYPKFVQPILDAKCKSCHSSSSHASGLDFTGTLSMHSQAKKQYAKSYSSMFQGIGSAKSNKAINIATIFSQAPQMPPYSYGSTKSGLIKAVNGNGSAAANTAMKEVKLTDKEKRILACWIDLEAPHAPSYDAYMSAADAQKYKSLEATAQKWYDIEAKNVKDWALVQPKVRVHRGTASASASFAEQLKIGYLPAQHILVLNDVSQGTFMLVDLKGKSISRMKLSHQTADDVAISLPKSLRTGLYVAKFKGVEGMRQAKIFIAQ